MSQRDRHEAPDTAPGSLGDYRERKHAPASVQAVADSVWLKLLQSFATLVGIPAAGLILNALAGQIGDMSAAIQAFKTAAATTELRIQALERDTSRTGVVLETQKATLADHEYRTRRLEELTPHARPTGK